MDASQIITKWGPETCLILSQWSLCNKLVMGVYLSTHFRTTGFSILREYKIEETWRKKGSPHVGHEKTEAQRWDRSAPCAQLTDGHMGIKEEVGLSLLFRCDALCCFSLVTQRIMKTGRFRKDWYLTETFSFINTSWDTLGFAYLTKTCKTWCGPPNLL